MSIKEQVLNETKKRLIKKIKNLEKIIFPEESTAVKIIELHRNAINECKKCNEIGDYKTPLLILEKADKEEKRLRKIMEKESNYIKNMDELIELKNQLEQIETELYFENRKIS